MDTANKTQVKKSSKMWQNWRCFRESTIHGLSHGSTTSNSIGFSFWMLVTFIFFGIGTWFNVELVRNFIYAPTFKSITVVKSYQNGLALPPLTICFNHRTTNSLLVEANMTLAELEYLTLSLMSVNSVMNINNSHMESLYQQFHNQTKIDYEDIENVMNLFHLITPKCEDLIFACSAALFNRLNCCREANHKLIVNDNGPCIELKFTEKLRQKVAGNAGGLTLGLILPSVAEYPNATFFAYLMDGIQLFLSPYDAVLENNPTYVKRGDMAMIEVNLEETFALNSDNCHFEKNATLDNRNAIQNRYYQECLVDCKRKERLKVCDCIGLSTFNINDNASFCTPAKARECRLKASNMSLGAIGFYCTQQCDDNCHRLSYSISKSAAPAARAELSAGLTQELGLSSTVSVSDIIVLYIYYSDIRYTLVKESYTQTWQSLLSNVGGIYGLWTGASLVSIVHIGYVVLANRCRKKPPLSQSELNIPFFVGQSRY